MGTLAEVNAAVAAQNQAVAVNAAAPPPVEAEKPAPQAAEEGRRAAQLETQPTTEDRKAERRAKLDGLKQLADATQQRFTEAQLARQQREKADGEIQSIRAEMEKLAKDAAEARSELQNAKKDPLQWIQGQGVKLRALAEQVAKGDTPDAKVEALQKALVDLEERNSQKIQALEQQYQTALKEAAEKEAKAAMQAKNAQAKAEFLDTWEKGKGKWPYLDRATDGNTQDLIREFMVTFKDVEASPETGPYIAEYSNEELLAATNARLEKLAKKLLIDAAPAAATSKPSLAESKPTLSTATAVEPASLPMDIKKLPPKEQTKVLAAIYKSLRKSG